MAELKSCQIVGTPYLEGKYIAVMDMWPLEDPALNRLYPFYDNLKQGRWTHHQMQEMRLYFLSSRCGLSPTVGRMNWNGLICPRLPMWWP